MVRGPHVATSRPHAPGVRMTGRSNKLPQIKFSRVALTLGYGVAPWNNGSADVKILECKEWIAESQA